MTLIQFMIPSSINIHLLTIQCSLPESSLLRLDKRKEELLQYLTPFKRTEQPRRKVSVEGFAFPIYTSDEVERLEEAVRSNPKTRNQYIAYLAERKPRHMEILECFAKFFTDEAMAPYAWNGCKNPRFPRKAMKTMDIFSDCMFAAWERHGVTSMESLADILTKVIMKIAGRRRSNNYNQRKRIQQFYGALHETGRLREENVVTGVTGFSFPLFCEEDVDRLEKTVKTDPRIRQEFVKYLTLLGEYRPGLFVPYFSKLFSDLSLYNYCVAQSVQGGHSDKKDMRNYDIFTSCMIEAWKPQGLTMEVLEDLLKSVVSGLNNRRQLSNQNRRKRSEFIQRMLLKENRQLHS